MSVFLLILTNITYFIILKYIHIKFRTINIGVQLSTEGKEKDIYD